jgi:hypothetical protein
VRLRVIAALFVVASAAASTIGCELEVRLDRAAKLHDAAVGSGSGFDSGLGSGSGLRSGSGSGAGSSLDAGFGSGLGSGTSVKMD